MTLKAPRGDEKRRARFVRSSRAAPRVPDLGEAPGPTPRGTFRERRWSKLRVAPGERLGAVSVASGTYHGLGFFRSGIRTAPPGGDHLSSPPRAGSGVLALNSVVLFAFALVF